MFEHYSFLLLKLIKIKLLKSIIVISCYKKVKRPHKAQRLSHWVGLISIIWIKASCTNLNFTRCRSHLKHSGLISSTNLCIPILPFNSNCYYSIIVLKRTNCFSLSDGWMIFIKFNSLPALSLDFTTLIMIPSHLWTIYIRPLIEIQVRWNATAILPFSEPETCPRNENPLSLDCRA